METKITRKENGLLDIDEMIKDAMKSKRSDELQALRNVKTHIMEFKTQEVKEGPRPEYTTEAELALIQKMAKELTKEVKAYSNVNTPIGKENLKKAVNEQFIICGILNEIEPPQATEEEIMSAINDWTIHYGGISPKDFKSVMNHVIAKYSNASRSDVASLIKRTM